MLILDILTNKSLKAKEKTRRLSELLLDKAVFIEDFIKLAAKQDAKSKATLIEAIEFASKSKPEIVSKTAFEYMINSLADSAPRVKWEAAKVISNTAAIFPKFLAKAVANLLVNTEHEGNVVRWSAATALGKILELNTSLNKELIPACEAIMLQETDNAVKKIYSKALHKCRKRPSS